MNEVSYMREAQIELAHEILYTFKKVTFEKNGYIFKVDEIS